jgi:hypothetical protein
MRYISPNVQFLFSQPYVSTYYLIDISGPNFNTKITTHAHDLTINGLGTFSANNQLAGFDPPILENAANREIYTLTFVDPEFLFRGTAELPIIGSRVKLYMGLINTTVNEIGGAQQNQPLLDTADLTLGFDGVIDSREYITDPIEGTNIFKIVCSTPMGKLEEIKSYITSKEFAKLGDAAYDNVYDKASDVELLWGKA